MAEIDVKLILDVEITLKLNEREAMALDALAGYGTDAFLQCFYKNMGQAYLKPYEQGLRSLFSKIRGLEHSNPLGEVRRAITEHERRKREVSQAGRKKELEAAKPRAGAIAGGVSA